MTLQYVKPYHLNYLAIFYGVRCLSLMAKIKTIDSNFVGEISSDAIERDPSLRKDVIDELLREHYLSQSPACSRLGVTAKSLGETEPLEISGRLSIGSKIEPHAVWLGAGILKSAILGLSQNTLKVATNKIDGKFYLIDVKSGAKELKEFEFLQSNSAKCLSDISGVPTAETQNIKMATIKSIATICKDLEIRKRAIAKQIRKLRIESFSIESVSLELSEKYESGEMASKAALAWVRNQQQIKMGE